MNSSYNSYHKVISHMFIMTLNLTSSERHISKISSAPNFLRQIQNQGKGGIICDKTVSLCTVHLSACVVQTVIPGTSGQHLSKAGSGSRPPISPHEPRDMSYELYDWRKGLFNPLHVSVHGLCSCWQHEEMLLYKQMTCSQFMKARL